MIVKNLLGTDHLHYEHYMWFFYFFRQLLNYNVASLEQERALKESQRLYSTLKEFIVKLPSIKIKAELNEVKVCIKVIPILKSLSIYFPSL